jgi:RecB family exonuclease
MASFSRLESILPGNQFGQFRGLEPQACICVGAGYSREDFKSLLLNEGAEKSGFTGNAVLTFPKLVLKIAQAASGFSGERVLEKSPARQEVLRFLLSMRGMTERFPELRRLKRQGAFWKRLDHAIQAARMSFVHWEEAQVFSARLSERQGEDPLRVEVENLAQIYENWMEAAGFFDPPSVLRKAVDWLSDLPIASEVPTSEVHQVLASFPDEIYYFSTQTQESLEREFWERLGRFKKIALGHELASQQSKASQSSDENTVHDTLQGVWQRWHTLDDASEALAAELARQVRAGVSLEDHVVLISDTPAARRSLRRALSSQAVALADPRDPTRSRWDEGLKWALLPLELVSRNFEKESVVAWVRGFQQGPLKAQWLKEIEDRGIRSGLESYSGGSLVGLHERLQMLQKKIGGKKSIRELGLAHLKEIQYWTSLESSNGFGQFRELAWVIGFFEQLWKDLATDLERVGLGARKAAPLYWLERLQSRISDAPAPVERLKPSGGLDVFRFHQAPVKTYRHVWFLGLPSNWLSGEGTGDYWFSERDREILSSEFSVRSGIQVRSERLKSLRLWLEGAEQVLVLDSVYDAGGRERETIASVIREIENFGRFQFEDEPAEMGSHPRWLKSYGALRPIQPQVIALPKRVASQTASGDVPILSASLLDSFSRCSFQALAQYRWKLRDLREADTELWPDIRGNILHEAVRLLVESRDQEGSFSKSPEEALELAWTSKRPRGLLRGARIESYVKYRLKQVLIAFCEKEREYIQRAHTRVLGLENIKFEVPFEGFKVVGEPDRIDEHSEGLFILDYKTASTSPSGTDILENGYRLQLPFYAIASQKMFGKSTLGFQFVQLDKKGTRSAGLFFEGTNGKDPGKLTATTRNNKSLMARPRDEVWSKLEEDIQRQGCQYIDGSFEAKPRITPRKKECDSCRIGDLCGLRRLSAETSADGEGEGE